MLLHNLFNSNAIHAIAALQHNQITSDESQRETTESTFTLETIIYYYYYCEMASHGGEM